MRILAGALLVLVGTAQAQNTPVDKSTREYLTGIAKDLEKEFLPGLKTGVDFEKARPKLREQYLDMLGLWPLPEKTPLKPVVTGTLKLPGVTVEKIHFQSRPGLYVTANLYLPDPAKGPYPAVLYSIGHYNGGRDGHKGAVSDHGLWFASHGYACLLYDTIELGELKVTHHGTYSQSRWWWLSAGYTPAGAECWNAIRAIDYLQSRPEVDPERIGATGISGGGAATFWISAADERIKISAPVSGMADLGYYVGEDGVNGHCDCMFLYNNYRWNWTTIAGLICPRPLLFVNSDADTIFPMSANDRVINRLKRLYSRFGESDKVDAVVSVGGHAYRTDLRRQIFEFFNRNFKGDLRRVEDADSGLGPDGKVKIKPVELRVFPEDKDFPADQINTRLDETFAPVGKQELPTKESFDAWRSRLVAELERRVFTSRDAMPTEVVVRVPEAEGVAATVIHNAPDVLQEDVAFWQGPAIGVKVGSYLQPAQGWTRKNPPNTIERSLVLLGMTADSARVWQIVRAPVSNHLMGRGQAGILAAYAALFNPKVQKLTVVDPPKSHREGPHFLGVLKVCDIPDVLGALAPRPLTLINAKDPAFDRVADLYRLAGASDKLIRK